MSESNGATEPTSLESRRPGRFVRCKRWFSGALGALGGVAIAANMVPSIVLTGLSAIIFVSVGALVARSHDRGRRLDGGDFEPELERKRAELRKYPGTPRAHFALCGLGDLSMRQGKLEEAVQWYSEATEATEVALMPELNRYARVMGAGCAALLGRDTDIDLDAPMMGGSIGYCLIARHRGQSQRVLAVRIKVRLRDYICYGARRFAHMRRLLALLQTAVRGDAHSLTPKQRAAMMAACPGEYDYIADHWPDVKLVIEELGLYQRTLAVARTRRR